MTVYFIQALGQPMSPVKIGCARNVGARLKSLQASHHAELNIIRAIPGHFKEENYFHQLFAHLHIRGEWFDFSPTMLTEIFVPPPPSGIREFAAYTGKYGGIARAKALSPERRSEIARQGAKARWNRAKENA